MLIPTELSIKSFSGTTVTPRKYSYQTKRWFSKRNWGMISFTISSSIQQKRLKKWYWSFRQIYHKVLFMAGYDDTDRTDFFYTLCMVMDFYFLLCISTFLFLFYSLCNCICILTSFSPQLLLHGSSLSCLTAICHWFLTMHLGLILIFISCYPLFLLSGQGKDICMK